MARHYFLAPIICVLALAARAQDDSSAKKTNDATASSFPVIDLGEFFARGKTARQKAAIAANVDKICRELGFFVIINHGVPERVIRRAWREVEYFFDLPLAEKLTQAPQMDDAYPYGYSAVGGETLSVGADADLEDDNDMVVETPREGDLKEMFATGPYDPASGIVAPRYPAGHGAFRDAWHAYYRAMEHLSARLLQLLARALRLDDDHWFAPFADRHACALRALNYPALAAKNKTTTRTTEGRTATETHALTTTTRASPHTDYGSLTILRSGGPGLQVRNRTSGRWVDVPHLSRSHFVINLGDLMNRWTNDRWTSTPHRVVFVDDANANAASDDNDDDDEGLTTATEGASIPLGRRFLRRLLRRLRAVMPRPGGFFRQQHPQPNGRRQSLAFFHNLNADANVSAIETCLEPGETPKWPPILAMDHLMQKHRASTTARFTEKETTEAEDALSSSSRGTPAPSFPPPTSHEDDDDDDPADSTATVSAEL